MAPRRAALAGLLLVILVASGAPRCIDVVDATVERPESYAYQANAVSFTLNHTCGGPRDVELYIGPTAGFVFLDNSTPRLTVRGAERRSVRFYPANGTWGRVVLSIVATDWTGGEPRLSGRTVELYVSNPLVQWGYWLAAIVLALLVAFRRRILAHIEPSPLPLVLGAYLVIRGWSLLSGGEVRQSVFEQGPITPAAVSALELAMFGLVLIAYGRTVTEAFRREPAVALVVLFVFTQIYPAEAYLGEDVLAAWRARSLAPLNDELLLVFGLPLFFLKEATLVYFLRPYSLVLTLGLGVPLTILYWSAVIHVCERGAASARSELARVLARIPVALHIHIGHQPAAAPAPQAPAPEPAPPGRRPPGARRRRRPREGSPGPVTAEGAPRSEGGDSNAGTADTPHERPLAKGRKAGRRAR